MPPSQNPVHTLHGPSESCFRSLFETTEEGAGLHRIVFDETGKASDYQIISVNSAFVKHTGIAAGLVEGCLASQAYPGEEPPYLEIYARVAATGNPEVMDVFCALSQRHLTISVFSPRRDWFIATFKDVSGRKLEEAESEHLNQLYAVLRHVNRAVVRTGLRDELFQQVCRIATRVGGFLMASVAVADPDSNKVRWIARSGDAHGYFQAIEITIDKSPHGRGPTGTALREGRTYVCNDFAADPRTLPWRELAAKSGVGGCIALPIENNGAVCAILTLYSSAVGFFQSKEVALLEEMADDVSFGLAHMEQEAALQETTHRFRSLLDEVRLVALGLDSQGAVTYANPFFFEITGYTPDEVMGKPWISDFIPKRNQQDFATVFSELLADEKHIHHENPICTKSGQERLIIWNNTVLRDRSGKPEGTMSIGEDITERKLMEENLFRAQRMESIGLLAGGIAHDLNNILSPIMMSASMLEENIPQKVRGDLICNIQEAALRGAGIVKQVLTFARGVKGDRAVLNPEVLSNEVWVIVRETFPKSINSTFLAPKGLWNIIGDHTQMCQVLLNLCVNARDAMPDGGELRLEFSNCEVGDRQLHLSPEAKPGRFVKFEVRDTGTGISPENMGRIFDPFFTTKDLATGTGLGLSTVMGIVRNHGGFVTAESELGKGTTFRVYIPATCDSAGDQQISGNSGMMAGKGEMILIVDDETDILRVAEMVLARNGYRVKIAVNGADAMACLAKNAADIKLIISDLMMPNMDGMNLVTMIRRFGFHVPIIAASGYGGERYQKELKSMGVNTILRKPFDAGTLLATIHKALHPR